MPSAHRTAARWSALLLLVAYAAGGCTKQVSVTDLIRDARAYKAKGESSAAIIQLSNALRKEPNNIEALLLGGRIFADTGELLQAENHLRKAIELGAAPEQALPAMGRVLLEMQRYRQVLADIEPDSRFNAESRAEISLLRGRAEMELGALKDAKADFSLALPAKPLEAKLGLAQVAAAQRDTVNAYKLVDQVIEIAPANADAWLVKGDFLRGESRMPEAAAAIQQSLKLRPAHVPALLSMALLHLQARKTADARAAIDQATKIAPAAPTVHYARALFSLHERNYSNCRDELQYVFRFIPDHMPSLLLSGALFHATGQFEQAQKAFLTFLKRSPENLYVLKLLAATLIKKAQPQSAAYVLEPALAQRPNDTELLALMGEAHLQSGDMDKARNYLETAVKLDPGNSNLRASLAVARLGAGENELGLADLETAVGAGNADMPTEGYLIATLIGQKHVDKALQRVQVIEEKRPNEPATYQLKGAVYLAQADLENARASFTRALTVAPTYYPAAAALAQMDVRAGNPQAARERFEALLKKDRRNLDALLTLANLEFMTGRHKEATDLLKRAIDEHPEVPQAYLALAHVQLWTGQAKEAISTASKARDMNPSDLRALDTLGTAQLAAGDMAGAVTSFVNLADAMPKSAMPLLKLAAAYSAKQEYGPAIVTLKKALRVEPANIDAKTALGIAYMQTNRHGEALAVGLGMQKSDPRLAHGYALAGDAHLKQRNYAAAITAYEKADAIERSGMLLVKMHQALSMAPGGEASDERILAWLKDHPQDAQTRYYLSNVYLKSDRYRDAIAQYQTLLKLNPKDSGVLNNLAWALHQEKDPRALEYAQLANQFDPTNAAVADTLGSILLSAGKFDLAMLILNKAVSLKGDVPEFRYHYAQALVQGGDRTRAAQELRALLAMRGQFKEANEARELLKTLE